MPDARARDLITKFNGLKSARGTWESHWEEVAKYVLPQYSGLFASPATGRTKGAKRREHQFDATAGVALERYTSVLESMVTPRNQHWHGLTSQAREIRNDREAMLWFDEVTNLLFRLRYEAKANFANNVNEVYTSQGAFGTGLIFIDEPMDRVGFRYRTVPLADCYLLLSHEGLPDTVYRRDVLTVRQVVQRWGEENVSDTIRKRLKEEPHGEVEILHVTTPREDIDRGRADFKSMPWASFYIEVEDQHTLEEGGYRTFPYAVARGSTAPREAYGRSPAMKVLPNIKVVNEQKKTHLKIGHRRADPPVLLHDGGVLDGFSLQPGYLNFGGVDSQGRSLVHPFPVGDPVMNEKLMEQERLPINDAFLVTLFQILVDNGTMTATEVIERTQEKAQLITPIMGRLEAEFLEPLIVRELDLLEAQGLLPEMPDALLEAGGRFEIQYESPLARAAKAEEAGGLLRSVEVVLRYVEATADPSPLDWYDWDVITPDLQQNMGLPERWRRTLKAVEQIRAQRNQQQQVEQMTNAAPALAAMARSQPGG